MKKKLLSFLISIFMLVGLIPTLASAAEGDPISVFDTVTYNYATLFS